MLVEILLFALILIFYWIWRKPADYPPGPWSLPLVGYLSLGTKTEDSVKKFNKKYGDIVSVKLGTRNVVIIYNYKLIKEAFSGPNMYDRPDLRMVSLLYSSGKFGIVATSGRHSQNIRQFSLRQLRQSGMGKSALVEAIQDEATMLVDELKKQAGKPAPLPHAISVCVLNIIWQMVASKRYNFHDKAAFEFENLIDSFLDNMSSLVLPDFFTWMNYIPNFILRKITKRDLYDDLADRFLKLMKVPVDEHIQTLDVNNPRDFIDSYLIEMNNQKDDPSSTMSMDDLLFCLVDLFEGGTGTTATTLKWAIFYLATNPDIQSKLQKEIDEVLPKGILPTLQEKHKFPYTEAFINEVLRYSSFVSLGVFHLATADTELGGYRIPKGAFVVGVHDACHFNPNYFESPEEFRPERFLDSEGKFVSPKEGFFPFGVGKRLCIGEPLARMEFFIFMTMMLQSLNFEVPPGETLDLTPIDNAFLNFPKDKQNVLITIRS